MRSIWDTVSAIIDVIITIDKLTVGADASFFPGCRRVVGKPWCQLAGRGHSVQSVRGIRIS